MQGLFVGVEGGEIKLCGGNCFLPPQYCGGEMTSTPQDDISGVRCHLQNLIIFTKTLLNGNIPERTANSILYFIRCNRYNRIYPNPDITKAENRAHQ